MLSEEIGGDEFLYRGIVIQNWDFENDRPSSATFKDSQGTSVDRSADRNDYECIEKLLQKRNFVAICKVLTKDVRDIEAVAIYKPELENIFHSEIHDSKERVQLRGKKPNKIRDKSKVVYKN